MPEMWVGATLEQVVNTPCSEEVKIGLRADSSAERPGTGFPGRGHSQCQGLSVVCLKNSQKPCGWNIVSVDEKGETSSQWAFFRPCPESIFILPVRKWEEAFNR